MTIAANDILQITDVQTFLAQQMLNVYFYRVISVGASADYTDVQTAWETVMQAPIQNIQNVVVSHDRLVVKNLTNGLDLAEQPAGYNGLMTGDAEPSFEAYSYRLVRSTTLTRHGSKRYGGLPDNDITDNAPVSGAMTRVNAVATALGAHIIVTGTGAHDIEAEPIIIGRFPIGGPTPGELDLSKVNPVSFAQFIRLTTQTTRRAGRGV